MNLKKLKLKQIEQDKTIKMSRFVNLNNEETSRKFIIA